MLVKVAGRVAVLGRMPPDMWLVAWEEWLQGLHSPPRTSAKDLAVIWVDFLQLPRSSREVETVTFAIRALATRH